MTLRTSVALSLLAVTATIAFTTACESPGHLASKMEGTWSGVPQRFDKEIVGDGTYTPVFEFTRPDNRPEGTVILSTQISVTMPVNAPIDSLGTSAVSATAAGLATISGLWTADEDDDIKIALDPSTLDITVDPDVEFEMANVFTSFDTDSTATVPPAVMKAFQEQMRKGMTDVISRINEFDDVEFHGGGMMSAKVGKQKLTFSRSALR